MPSPFGENGLAAWLPCSKQCVPPACTAAFIERGLGGCAALSASDAFRAGALVTILMSPSRAPTRRGAPFTLTALALTFHDALTGSQPEPASRPALESVANDILMSGDWSVEASFPWHSCCHINVLELAAYGALTRDLARSAPDSRFSALLDSQVAKAAAAKGRSTAKALCPGLGRIAAVQFAFGLYPSLGFAPTRLNVADDPTRHCDLRQRSEISITQLNPFTGWERAGSAGPMPLGSGSSLSLFLRSRRPQILRAAFKSLSLHMLSNVTEISMHVSSIQVKGRLSPASAVFGLPLAVDSLLF